MDGVEPFKWHRDMIPDVIDSRRNALRIKDEELTNGRKLSFHALWAAEFKKIHPNSTFTSNNLSVHFWTWRKQQQKLQANAKKYQAKLDQQSSSSPGSAASASTDLPNLPMSFSNSSPILAPKRPHPASSNGTFKDSQAREKLMEVGGRVEKMLQDPDTPNETKLKGFAQVLHDEWSKGNTS